MSSYPDFVKTGPSDAAGGKPNCSLRPRPSNCPVPAILSPSLDSTVPCGSYAVSVKLLPMSPNILDYAAGAVAVGIPLAAASANCAALSPAVAA